MSRLARVTDVQHQRLAFLSSDHISSFHEISEGTEITLRMLSFAIVIALLATTIKELAHLCEALPKKLFPSAPKIKNEDSTD
jgi:hypothetical protein